MPAQRNLTLLTDLYQLTMAQSYFREQQLGDATFSLFIRSYPLDRGYFVSAGLSDVLDYLENFAFDPAAIEYLARQKQFSDEFLHYLAELRFTGEVWAIPEGQIFFKDEPVLEVTAPIIQAQIIETFIINQIHLQTLIATKAARCVHAARRPASGRLCAAPHPWHRCRHESRPRQLSHGLSPAPATSWLDIDYGIPIVGTMAHSFVSSFEREIDAFRAYVASFPKTRSCLIDTYDTLAGARHAVQVAKEMAARGQKLLGVRIDSGDLAGSWRARCRKIFDEADLTKLKIIGSGGLDEYRLGRVSALPTCPSIATASAPKWARPPTRHGRTCPTNWWNIKTGLS